MRGECDLNKTRMTHRGSSISEVFEVEDPNPRRGGRTGPTGCVAPLPNMDVVCGTKVVELDALVLHNILNYIAKDAKDLKAAACVNSDCHAAAGVTDFPTKHLALAFGSRAHLSSRHPGIIILTGGGVRCTTRCPQPTRCASASLQAAPRQRLENSTIWSVDVGRGVHRHVAACRTQHAEVTARPPRRALGGHQRPRPPRHRLPRRAHARICTRLCFAPRGILSARLHLHHRLSRVATCR